MYILNDWIEGRDYRKKILFDENDLDSAGVRIQIVEIEGNTKVDPHHHKSQTEVYNIQSGKAVMGIGEDEYNAQEGDTLICKPEQTHYVKNNNSEIFRILVIKTNYEKEDSYWEE